MTQMLDRPAGRRIEGLDPLSPPPPYHPRRVRPDDTVINSSDVCRMLLELDGISVSRVTVCKSLDRLFGRAVELKYLVRTLSQAEASISRSVFNFVHRCGLTRAEAEDLYLNRELLTAQWRALALTEPDTETSLELATAAELLAGPVWEDPAFWDNPAQAELVAAVFNRVNRPSMDFSGGEKEALRTEETA